MATTVSAYCASCGETVEADAQTGRCPGCGKLATTHLPTRSLAEVERNSGVTHRSPSAAYRPDPTRTALDNAIARQQAGTTASQHDSKPATDSAPSPDLTRFRLPSSAPTRKWLETTRALREGLTKAAAAADQKAADIEATVASQVAARQAEAAKHRAEAVRLRNSARVISQLLEQVGIETEHPETGTRKKPGPQRSDGLWAKSRAGEVFPACIGCGRTDRKHKSKGRCTACYERRGAA